MKAALLKQSGKIEDLEKTLVVEDVPMPEINEDEVLIKIKNASLNHRDLWIAKGLYSKINLPVVPGSDGTGVVTSIGSKVKEFVTGDEVLINPGMNWGSDENYQSRNFKIFGMPDNGTFAEFTKINCCYVYKKPGHLTFAQASAFPLTGITSYRALFKKGEIKKSDNVLITGIGGGVSTSALVFALSIGTNVFVTSGDNLKIQKAISLGAKAGVNYNEEDWDKKIIEASEDKINLIIDGAGGETFSKCVEICNYGGRIVSFGATLGEVQNFKLHRLYWKQMKIFGSTMGSQNDFADMIKFINEKKIIPVVDQTFSLENICDAFHRMNESKHFGKIVIEI